MQRRHLFLLISALAASLPALANEPMFVQVPAEMDRFAMMPDRIRKECGVETLMGNRALSEIASRYSGAQAVENQAQAGEGTYVQLTIMAASGFGGGAMSGPKSMTVRASLRKGSVTLGTTMLTRAGRGGMFGIMKNTCSILGGLAEDLGADIAVWISRGAGQTGPAPVIPVAPATTH